SAEQPNLDRRVTARMELSRPGSEDLADLCRMEQDTPTMEMLLGVRPADKTAAIAERLTEHWAGHGLGWWIAREKGTGTFLGRGGLRRVTIDGTPEVEVGYGFH